MHTGIRQALHDALLTKRWADSSPIAAEGGPALTSLRMLRLKQQNRILRCPGFRPSTMEGMERSRSARENSISSCMAWATAVRPVLFDVSSSISASIQGLCQSTCIKPK